MSKDTLSAIEKVKISRRNDRPTALDYISKIFDSFLELHGDRLFGDDSAVVGGVARFQGREVTVIGQQKGRNTKENIKRNFGMPNPEGYRKAVRLMKLADKFNQPVICFVDTPGAYCGIEAEERGQGEAIARAIYEMSDLSVPVLSIFIGEGGSGGALALGVANNIFMLENATYSILSPEGFAAILWKDAERADEAAEVMKITADDLKNLHIIDRIISESEDMTVNNMEETVKELVNGITDFIAYYSDKSRVEIRDERYERFIKF